MIQNFILELLSFFVKKKRGGHMSRRISETIDDYRIKLHTQDDGRIMRSWRSCLLSSVIYIHCNVNL